MRGRAGFTLIEVIIAIGLATMVFLGITMITASALRSHFEQIRYGQDNSTNLAGIDNMVRVFEGTSHLEPCYPPTLPWPAYCGGASLAARAAHYSEVRACSDYSAAMGGALDGVVGNVKWYDFCVSVSTLWYYSGGGCPPAGGWPTASSPCGTGPAPHDAAIFGFYPAGSLQVSGVPNSGDPVFVRQDFSDSIAMQYIVGVATPTQNVPIPVHYDMQIGSGLQKSYQSPLCAGGAPCD